MATINVNTFDTIEEWRLKSNELGVKVADLDNNLYTINVIASGNVTASGNINALGNVVVSRDAVVSGNIVGASNAIITGNVIAANVLANVHYGTYVTSKPAINVLFNANITGSANLLLSSSGTNILTISANVAADSVTLGTHTIGNYVKEISSADTSNIIVNSGVGEGTTPTVNLAMTNVTPGVYGNTNAVSTFTVTKDGRLTASSNLLIDRAYALVTNKPSMNVRFLGNIVGNANLLLSSEGTNFLEVYANVAADSVTLGTHTVGDYVKSMSSADISNIIVNSGTGEGSTPSVNLAMTNVTPGSYGNANAVSSFTVTKDGRLTAASNLLIDRAYILTAGKPSINLNFTGDVTGKANLNLSAENTNSLDVALTVQTNSVALGTDTTGNYVENLVQGSGITLTSATPTEGGTPTISANVTSVGSFVGAVSNTNLLASILQVDGAASLLDADLLDGQQGTYYLDWTNQTNKPAINLTFTGDVTGTGGVVLTNSGTNTLSIALTSATNSVALGTDTTGNYTDRVVPGTGMTATGTADEGNVITVGLASSGVTAAGYGNANVVSQITVDSTGRITSASNVAIDRRYATVTEKPSINLRFTGDATGNGNINISQTDKNELSINMIVSSVGSGTLPTTTVTPGTYGGGNTYAAFTVDSTGRLTAASNVALADTGVAASTYGGSNTYAVVSVDSKGRVTSASNVAISDTGVTAGSYGDANAVSQVTVDSKGRVTAASNLLIDRAYTLTTGKPSVNLAFTGDVTGSGSINLANENTNSLSIGLTIAADSIALGTDTTGNYTNRVVPGSCITVSGTADEGNVITINHSDTSTLNGLQGGSGIASITVDDRGHVTAVTTATYCSSVPTSSNVFSYFGGANGNTISQTNQTHPIINTSAFNFFAGRCAGNSITTGAHNVAFGNFAGFCLAGGAQSVNAFGDCAGYYTCGGSNNNFFGCRAGYRNTTGSYNNFFGRFAGQCNTTGCNNTFIGGSAGSNNTIGQCNIFIGCSAGTCNTSGSRNIAFGRYAGNITTGNDNIIFGGLSSCVGLTGSTSNVIIMATGGIQSFNIDSVYCNFVVGRCSGTKLSTGSFNFIAGFCSGTCITSANHNFFAGRCAGSNATSSDNIMIGDCAGRNVTAQSRNIFIGPSSAGCSVACATGGTDNVGIGPFTLRDFSCGCLNSAVGYGAGIRNNTGSYNTYLGSFTGCDITSGSRNLFAGFRGNITTGNDNIIFGCLSSCVGLTGSTSNVIIMATGGMQRFEIDPNLDNISAGTCAGYCNTTGTRNVFIGRNAGFKNTFGCYNNFIGMGNGACNTTGSCNNFIGSYAGERNTVGTNNNFIGRNAGRYNVSGCHNNFLGEAVGYCNTTGSHNNFFGRYAGFCNTTGCHNTFIGFCAGFNNSNGRNNTFIGFFTGFNNTTGSCNFFAGLCAGYCNTSGCENIAMGTCAGFKLTTGCNNSLFGSNTGKELTTGKGNSFFGSGAGTGTTTGCYNTFLGCSAGLDNTTGIRNVAIGIGAAQYSNRGIDNINLGTNTGSYVNGCRNVMIGTAVGFYSCIQTGCNNIGVGTESFYGCALYDVDANVIGANPPIGLSGGFNLAMGYRAAAYLTTGNNNIFIGCCAGSSVSGLGCCTTQSNRIIMGNTSHTCACIQIAWTTPSDIRDKCIFGPVPHGKSFLNNINPITFSFKNRETNELKDNRKRYGFSAQEVLAAEGEEPVIVGTENPDKLGFTSDFIIPILVNAVKELTKDVEELRAEIAELKKSR